MEQELANSFHLGSDKNKSKLAKKVSKGNVSGTTSFSNNAIQNARGNIMIIRTTSGDILKGNETRIVFAVNAEGVNDSGFAGVI